MCTVILLSLLSFLPDNLQSWYASCSLGDWDTASTVAEEIYSADSTDTDALAAAVIASAMLSEYLTGYSMDSLKSDYASSLSRTALAVLLMSGTDSFLKNAENQLNKSIWFGSDNVLAWYFIGILHSRDDSVAALNSIRRAVSLDPGFLPAKLEESRLLRDCGNFDEAIAGLQSIMGDDSPAGRLALAEYILLIERSGEAAELDSLENLLVLADSSAWIILAEEQLHRRHDISLAAAEKAAAVSDSALFALDLAAVFLELDEYSRAILISRNILESASSADPLVLEILGTAYFMNDELSRAKEIFTSLKESDPLSLPALVYLGDIAEMECRTVEAVNYYLSALELDTYNIAVRNRLRVIAGDSYNPESSAASAEGFSVTTAADLSIERGNRAMLEWGGSSRISYRFDRRGTSVDAVFGGRSVTWEESSGFGTDTLNTSRGWANLRFDYWFSDSYFVETAVGWDRQMYTERPWQLTSYGAIGWQKWILSWLWFSPKLGFGSVNTRWTSGTNDVYTNDFSVFAAAGLWYSKPHTFIREAEISGNVYFPPDNPENFITEGSVSLAFRTWSPLFVTIGYNVDYTRVPEISTWKKFNTSFVTSINFDLF